MKIAIKILLSLLLLASLSFNAYTAYIIGNTDVKYKVPTWNQEEFELLKHAYKEIIDNGDAVIGLYPYEVKESDSGYTVRFRMLEFLQLIESPIQLRTMHDGCVYYHFSKEVKLLEITNCG